MTPRISRQASTLREPFAPLELLAYSCSCGWQTDWFRTRCDNLAQFEVRRHLARVHGDEIGAGLCGECGQPADDFRAVTKDGTVWLCERHSPSMTDLGFREGDAEHPYSVPRSVTELD